MSRASTQSSAKSSRMPIVWNQADGLPDRNPNPSRSRRPAREHEPTVDEIVAELQERGARWRNGRRS